MPATEPSTWQAREADTFTIEAGETRAVLHKFGATVISWSVNGRERLFVSSKALWDGSKPIRGGIPLVFPQFGTGPITAGQHGFARSRAWTVQKLDPSTLLCTLRESAETLAVWPHKFCLRYRVSVRPGELETALDVENPLDGSERFYFTALLHTYFSIHDIKSAKVAGLQHLRFSDKLLNGQQGTEDRGEVVVAEEVDRTYMNVPGSIQLSSQAGTVEISKQGFPDMVFWNPWVEKSRSMADFGDEEYQQMLCLEVGHVAAPVTLSAGMTWSASQVLRVPQ